MWRLAPFYLHKGLFGFPFYSVLGLVVVAQLARLAPRAWKPMQSGFFTHMSG